MTTDLYTWMCLIYTLYIRTHSVYTTYIIYTAISQCSYQSSTVENGKEKLFWIHRVRFFFLANWLDKPSFCGQKDCTKYLLLCPFIPQWWCAICKVSLLLIFTRSLLANPFFLKWYVLCVGMTLAKLKIVKHPYHWRDPNMIWALFVLVIYFVKI